MEYELVSRANVPRHETKWLSFFLALASLENGKITFYAWKEERNRNEIA